MNFIIFKDEILQALTSLVNVIEKKQTMAVLANVHLSVDDSELTLTGSDLEIQIIAKLPVTGKTNGKITVPAKKLLDICRSFSSNIEINFNLQSNKLKISSGRSRFLLSTLPADEYPFFLEDITDYSFKFNCQQLKRALIKTVFCISVQDIRFYLNGLFFEINGKDFKLIASDGHRLATYKGHLQVDSEVEAKFIVPKKGVMELIKILDDNDEMVTLEYSKNNIKITHNNYIFSAKLIDSEFPDFSKIYAQDFNQDLYLDKLVLKEIFTRVAVLANEKSNGVNLKLKENNLFINTHNPEQEEADEEIPIEYVDETISVSFNVMYLIDAISNIDPETFVMTIASNSSCCFISDPDSPDYRYIIMSMKL